MGHFHQGCGLGCALIAIALSSAAGAQPLESVTVFGAAETRTLATTRFTTTALQDMGVTSLTGLSQAVPGLRLDVYGASLQPTLRGAGIQNVLGPGVDSEVAVTVDGFAQNNLDSLFFDLADIERVDVLKGPQGTLAGQNAIAGTIALTTADPVFTNGARASIAYGAFNDVRVGGSANVALSDTLAADLSVIHRSSDNYFTDSASGKPSAPIDALALRGKLLFQPNADTRLVLAADYADRDDPSGLAYVVGNPSAALYHDVYGVPMVHTTTPYRTSLNRDLRVDSRDWSISLTGSFEMDWAALTSRTRFRRQQGNVRADLDGTSIAYWNLDYAQGDQTFSQEIDLAGKSEGSLRWHGGAIYSNDLGNLAYYLWQDVLNTGAATPLLHSQIRVASDEAGLFGGLDYDLATDWTLSGSARLSYERKSMRSALLMAPFIPGSGARDWTDLTPRLALSHGLGDDASVYASVSQGFKSGSFNYVGVGPQAPVKAEHVTQYEVGYKRGGSDWSLDAAAYYASYRDLQAFTYQSSCGCFQFANAPRAEVYGVEADARIALTDTISARAAAAYTHARYRQFTGEAPTGAPLVPPFYGYATGPTNFAGDPMIRSPDWTGDLSLMWHLPTVIGTWSATANLSLTSTVPFTPDRQLVQSGYGLVNLSAGWASVDGLWSVMLSGNNVTIQRYQNFSAEGLLGHSIVYGAPSSWMAKLERRL